MFQLRLASCFLRAAPLRAPRLSKPSDQHEAAQRLAQPGTPFGGTDAPSPALARRKAQRALLGPQQLLEVRQYRHSGATAAISMADWLEISTDGLGT